ncbi:hypothetical protein GCM10023115_46930 [Pontixanthobacter gangjinensis]|uniref:DUF4595 domain-containing protein n=1 Tax=Christiangramia aestuarii TaxID=1028746 RepID=A0A7M3SX84_9FLAO|nr:hypothetical protein [Christiangramia aestuarii]MUP41215.1 hypothetical protein [Christiangramia aestuarii]
MNKFYKFIWGAVVLFLVSACASDDDRPDPGDDPNLLISKVRFEKDLSIIENAGETEIKLLLEPAARTSGEIKVRLQVPDEINLGTNPGMIDNYISLQIEKGAASASFKVIPENDELLKGHQEFSITFGPMSSGFRKSEEGQEMLLSIIDDELDGKPKSFAGGGIKVEYKYSQNGKISRVTNKYSHGYEDHTTYHYNSSGTILETIHQATSAVIKNKYYWEEDKLVRSEEFIGEEMRAYSLYDYDEAGNIGSKVVYLKNDQGDFKENFVYVYLYFDTGNFYKQIIYLKVDTEEEYALISSRSYENYLDKPNLFPVNQVVPGIMTQHNLPGLYRLEENGVDFSFEFTYEYNEKGYAVKRVTDGEVITYEYY